jgi:hypothetical protein
MEHRKESAHIEEKESDEEFNSFKLPRVTKILNCVAVTEADAFQMVDDFASAAKLDYSSYTKKHRKRLDRVFKFSSYCKSTKNKHAETLATHYDNSYACENPGTSRSLKEKSSPDKNWHTSVTLDSTADLAGEATTCRRDSHSKDGTEETQEREEERLTTISRPGISSQSLVRPGDRDGPLQYQMSGDSETHDGRIDEKLERKITEPQPADNINQLETKAMKSPTTEDKKAKKEAKKLKKAEKKLKKSEKKAEKKAKKKAKKAKKGKE